MKPILEVEDLKKYYGKGDNQVKALNGITFQVMPGEFLGIMGSSGSGKSTLLNCIATVVDSSSGKISIDGKSILDLSENELSSYRGKSIGYLFQNFELIDNLTNMENILLPLSLHQVAKDEGVKRLNLLSKYFDILDILDKFPSQISWGQRQRVAAVRSLILNPRIVLADEPTGALDSKNAKNLMEKLLNINSAENTTILMVTHDFNAASFCSRILFIQDGNIIHELRRDFSVESQYDFYNKILKVMSQLGGGINAF